MSGQAHELRPDELIEHGPVTLRRFRADDVDAVFAAVTESLDHLRPWLPWAAGYTRDSAAQYLDNSIPRKLGFTEIERRPLDPPPEGGNGTGVVWRLLKTRRPNEVT